MSAAELLTSDGYMARRQKVAGEVDVDIAMLLYLLRKIAVGEMPFKKEEEAITIETSFNMPFTGPRNKKIIIEVDRLEQRFDCIMKLFKGICNGEIYC